MEKRMIEIVSPAGNLEKLRIAIRYGADAVYFGGDYFNLRIQAGNFSHDHIEQALDLCKENNVKTLFLLNSFLHEADLAQAKQYISEIKDYDFNAIMISDPAMVLMLREAGVTAELHLSTQMNTLNHMAIKFWNSQGIKRVVLGREASLEEIRKIKENTDVEIEIFAHGALCMSYSGRCLLSRYLSGRDANQGDCSHPCRWRYSLVEEKRPGSYLDIIEHAKGTEILASKDLCLLEKLEAYIEAGVDAFKIEGRMKSLYHAANTTRVYKHAARLAGTPAFAEHLPFWVEELDLINHRPYTSDLFNEFDNMGYQGIPYIKRALFLGYTETRGSSSEEAYIKAFNPIYKGEEVDAIFPIQEKIEDDKYIIEEIRNKQDKSVDMARPGEVSLLRVNKPMPENAILRRRL
ncbi:MAG: U32 family peptidase [bacterium]|nr:U32 family peptidase [bacterium]